MGNRKAVMQGRRPHAFAWAAGIATFMAAAASWSEPPARAPVALHLPDCTAQPFAYPEFTRVVREQLARDGVPWVGQPGQAGAANAWSLELQGACGRDAPSTSMQVRSPTGLLLQREVPLHDIPFDVRARSLAFVAAELVRAAYHREASAASAATSASAPPAMAESASAPPAASTSAPPAPSYPPVPPPAIAPATSASVRPEPALLPTPSPAERPAFQRKTAVGLAIQTRLFTSPATWSAGVRAHARLRAIAFGADWLAASASEESGTVRGDILAGWVQLIILQHRSDRWWMGAGPRASFGVAMAGGTPGDGARAGSAREPYIDGALQVDGRWSLGGPWGMSMGADAGVARGLFATADGNRTMSLGGWFAGMRLGLEGGF